jgi:hypothetical protein
MTTNHNDDIFKNIAKAMEELLNNMPIDESSRFIGCTIITGPGEDPKIFHVDDSNDEEINYEVIEGPEKIYISAEVPASVRNAPYVDIQQDKVVIHVDDDEVTIDLPCSAHIGQSTYTVSNGIIDIVCQKL